MSMNELGETEDEEVDRISDLPDSVLTYILSLIPTKDFVSTSTLSTRWNHLYASVPSLDFRNKDGDYTRHPNPAFPNYVTKVLNTVVQNLRSILKLRIHYIHSETKNSNIISWIETAILHSVQILDVSVSLCDRGPRGRPMPHCLFTSATLVSLSLDLSSVLSVPDLVCLPKLKKLYLKDIVLRDESDNESARRLFSSCPLLEDLSVMYWFMIKNVNVFDVSVPSLKVLTLIISCTPPDGTANQILINCPNLEILDCHTYGTKGYSGDLLGSLKKSYIKTYMYSKRFTGGKQLLPLVKQVCRVQFLSLHGDTMQALLNPSCSLPTFENLTHLELGSQYTEGWRLLLSLLESSPRLETLVLPIGFSDINDECKGVPFSPPERVPICLSFHLKVIRINKFYGKEDEYKLAEYFLTNALVLEKMVISPRYNYVEVQDEQEEKESEEEGKDEGDDVRWDDYEDELTQFSDRQFDITKRLLNFQRFSKICNLSPPQTLRLLRSQRMLLQGSELFLEKGNVSSVDDKLRLPSPSE